MRPSWFELFRFNLLTVNDSKRFKEVTRAKLRTQHATKVLLSLLDVGKFYVLVNSKTASRFPPPPSPNPAFDWSFAPYALVQWGIWPKLRPAQSGAFDFRVKSLDFVILSAFSMCTLFTVNCSYIYSLFCWSIWDPLEKPIKCGLSQMSNVNEINKPL